MVVNIKSEIPRKITQQPNPNCFTCNSKSLYYSKKELLGSEFSSEIINITNLKKLWLGFLDWDNISVGTNSNNNKWFIEEADKDIFDNMQTSYSDLFHGKLGVYNKNHKIEGISCFIPNGINMFDMDSISEFWIVVINDKIELRQTDYDYSNKSGFEILIDKSTEITDSNVIQKMENTILAGLKVLEEKEKNYLKNKEKKQENCQDLKFKGSKKKISKEDIEQIEINLKIEFPLSFIEHYLKFNGGVPEKQFFYSEKSDIETEIQLFSPLKYTSKDLQTVEEKYLFFKEKSDLMTNFLPFSNDYGGNPVCIDLKSGKIYIVYMDLGKLTKDKCFKLLANNFKSFLNGLRENSIDDEDD